MRAESSDTYRDKLVSLLAEMVEPFCMCHGHNLEYGPCEAVFVPGRAQGDWEGMFPVDSNLLNHASTLARLTLASLVVPGHDGSYDQGVRVATGYPGYVAWQDHVLEISHKSGDRTEVLPTPIPEGRETETHTPAETDGFVRLAQRQSWHEAIVVAHTHQLPRVIGCLLKSFQVVDYPLRVRPAAPPCESWNLDVFGSLGAQCLPRHKHIPQEIGRILRYLDKGWMVPLAEVKKYLLSLQSTP